MSTRVYEPVSSLQHPIKLLVGIFHDFWTFRELCWLLFTRDLKAQYRQSYLGYAWLVLPILSTSIVWIFLEQTHTITIAPTEIPYPLFVLLGTLSWTTFTSAVNLPNAAFQTGLPTFMKLNVPPEAFFASGLARVAFDLLIRILVLAPVFFVFQITPPYTLILFPICLLTTILAGIAIGLVLLPLSTLYHDVTRLTALALNFGIYISPVLYPPPKSGLAAQIVSINPLTPLLTLTRSVVTTGTLDGIAMVIAILLVSLGVIVLGLMIFRTVLPILIERMGM